MIPSLLHLPATKEFLNLLPGPVDKLAREEAISHGPIFSTASQSVHDAQHISPLATLSVSQVKRPASSTLSASDAVAEDELQVKPLATHVTSHKKAPDVSQYSVGGRESDSGDTRCKLSGP